MNELDGKPFTCPYCNTKNCQKTFFHLCPACNGEGCSDCSESIIPGIFEGEVEHGNNIEVCSETGDPEIDAGISDTRASLIKALLTAKQFLMENEE